jgi:hypothetical protein
MADKPDTVEIEEQAALFALGVLSPEEAARFRDRLSTGCPHSSAELQACQNALAALALSAGEVPAPPAARARLLASLTEEASAKAAFKGGLLLREGETGWEPSPVPGVEIRSLYKEKTLLVRMAPKTWYPAHEHHTAEQCLVLEGSITSAGVTAYAGDFTYLPAGSSHQPLYSETGCLLFIAYA